MPTVQVLTKPQCVQCTQTKKALDKLNIEYVSIDITEDAAALQKAKDLGFLQAPVVITEDDAWSGFRLDKIKQIVTA